MSLSSIILQGYFAGLLFIMAMIITFPPPANLIKKELNTSSNVIDLNGLGPTKVATLSKSLTNKRHLF
jgi:hypothetical protein